MADQRDSTEALDSPASSQIYQPSVDVGDHSPPRILGNRYLLEEQIARGGMASVWRAHDEKLARTVAVKLLHRHLSHADDFRERFRREAVSAAKLSHPGIVGVYDTGADGGWAYLVMEYVEGFTLAELLGTDAPLSPGQVASIGEQVATALDTANTYGLIHRDIKPANILIDREGSAKVTDFGIAKASDGESDLTRTGTVLGTAAYLAPEQIRGRALDHRADQYALGCVLYEALTGRKPFTAATSMEVAALRLEVDPLDIRSVRTGVPAALSDIVMRALRRNPEERWPDNRAFAAALSAFAGAGDLPDTQNDFDDGPTITGEHSFIRSEGRWLGIALIWLTVAAVLVGVGLATGVIEADGIPTVGALEVGGGDSADQDGVDSEDATTVVPGADQLMVFDPLPDGDGTENDDQLGRLVDGDPTTAWETEVYFNQANFGGLKPGVGVAVDLGEQRTVLGARISTPRSGITVQLYTADNVPDTIEGWSPLGDPVQIDETATIEVDPTTARYVLVWLTGDLVSVGEERFQGALGELAIVAEPA